MKKVLFICHGNICRSPMAEFIFKDIIVKRNLEKEYYCESAATSTEEIGCPIYPPALRELNKHGIYPTGKRARQITKNDLDNFDYIICMDERNISYLKRMGLYTDKITKLLDYVGGGDVADPWYTDNFSLTYTDIVKGIEGFLKK